MILRGLLERSLGGFICVRGYAKLSDLAKISKPNDQYQRDLVPEHKEDLEKYLDARSNVFFPEVIMSYTINEVRDNIVISGTAEPLEITSSKNKIIKIKQFNKSYTSAIDRRQKEMVRVVTLDIDDILGTDLIYRIDGNHRLSAAEDVDEEKANILAPFCLILLNESDANAKQQSIIFHNINSKGLALTSEENLKAILDNNRFQDEELTNDFGWTYLTAKKLVPEIDKDYLSALNHVFDKKLRSVLLTGLKFLDAHKLITETTGLSIFKKKLTDINNIYKQEPRLHACNETGLLNAFLYYAFKDKSKNNALPTAFKNWVLRNHIDEIKNIDAASIVDVFDKVHESLIKIFMAMPYIESDVDDYNRALSEAVNEINQSNPHLNLMNHSIMRTHSPTHDVIADILNKIETCDIFIADITGNNANVLYEYGHARGQKKPCILIRKKSDEKKIKSDFANDLRIHFQGYAELKTVLKSEIEHVLKVQGMEVK